MSSIWFVILSNWSTLTNSTAHPMDLSTVVISKGECKSHRLAQRWKSITIGKSCLEDFTISSLWSTIKHVINKLRLTAKDCSTWPRHRSKLWYVLDEVTGVQLSVNAMLLPPGKQPKNRSSDLPLNQHHPKSKPPRERIGFQLWCRSNELLIVSIFVKERQTQHCRGRIEVMFRCVLSNLWLHWIEYSDGRIAWTSNPTWLSDQLLEKNSMKRFIATSEALRISRSC